MSTRPEKTIDEKVDEICDRTRRTETRLTKFMDHMGFDTQTMRPRWDDMIKAIHLPSPAAGLDTILREVPPDYYGDVHVYHRTTLMMVLRRPRVAI